MLLSNRVYEEIFNAMLTKRLGPGDRLNRRQVAEDLGVSVAPVLEAMTQLEWEGFLTTSPRRGTIVREVPASQVLGRFHLRIAIEAQAARLYAGLPLEKHRGEILELAENVDRTSRGGADAFRAELRFHQRLVDAADCQVLSETFGQVMRHSLYYAAKQKLPQPPRRTKWMHTKLVEKLCESEPVDADSLIRQHLAPWILLLERAANEELAVPDQLDARGEGIRLNVKKKLRPKRQT